MSLLYMQEQQSWVLGGFLFSCFRCVILKTLPDPWIFVTHNIEDLALCYAITSILSLPMQMAKDIWIWRVCRHIYWGRLYDNGRCSAASTTGMIICIHNLWCLCIYGSFLYQLHFVEFGFLARIFWICILRSWEISYCCLQPVCKNVIIHQIA